MSSRPRESALVHTSVQPIRWGDMDALGHVNNTVYFRYMEQARIEWLFAQARADGGGYAAGTGPVIANASCTFHEPLVYPGDCEVRMYLAEPGRSSVGSFYEIWKDGRKFASGAGGLSGSSCERAPDAAAGGDHRAIACARGCPRARGDLSEFEVTR